MRLFTRVLFTLAFTLGLTTAFAAPAAASTITLYDNFTGTVDGAYAMYGTNIIGGVQTASAFTPGTGATFDSVTIMADYYGGSADWVMSLESSVAGLPGVSIETLNVTLPAHVNNVFPLVTFTSLAHPVLAAGTQYWIVMGAAAANTNGQAEWWEENGGGAGAQEQNGGPFISESPAPTLHVEGLVNDDVTPVPEPASLLLVGTGVAAGVRRFRKSGKM